VRIFAIDPNDPTQLNAEAPISMLADVPQLIVVDDRLTLVSQNKLNLYDISDPQAVVLLGTYTTPSANIRDLAVNNDNSLTHILVGNRVTSLNTSDPTSIYEVGHYEFTNPPFEIAAARDEVYALHPTTLSILQYTGGLDVSLEITPPQVVAESIERGGVVVTPVTIKNNGNSIVSITSIISSIPEFTVNDTTILMDPGEQFTRDVVFHPDTMISNVGGAINISHNGVSSPSAIPLSGQTREDPIRLDYDDIWQNYVPIGGSQNSAYVVDNSSFQQTVTIDGGYITGTVFEGGILGQIQLPPRSYQLVPFTFRPVRPGWVTETVIINYLGKTQQVELRGYGVGPFLEQLDDSLNLPETPIGALGEKTEYLQNIGNEELLLTNIVYPSPPFLVTFDSLNIRLLDSLQYQVIFSPTQTGVFSDSIVIEHNSITSPTVIHLVGEGVFGNASNMVLLGGRDTPGRSEGLTLSGNSAFLADSGNGIVVMSIADPQNISVSSELSILEELHRIEVSGNLGYAVAENGFFYTLNLADTSAIALYDDLPLPGTPNDIALQGLYAYVSAGTEGLRIINIADPTNPFQLSFLNLPDFASGIAVEGNYAYVACGDSGLQVVDVSNLFSPAVVANLALPGIANELLLDGNRLFISLTNAGVQEVDVTDPLQPQTLRLIDAVGESVDLATSGDTLYVAALEDGVRVHDLAQSNATEIAFYELPGELYSIEARSDTVYVAAGNSGLFILRLAGGVVGTGEETQIAITEFALQQNYPNPFNPETRIAFDLPQRSSVELVVYDLLGRAVQTLKSGTLPAGQHQATWNGRDTSGKPQSSGVYVYQLQYETADGKRGMLSEKMVLLK